MTKPPPSTGTPLLSVFLVPVRSTGQKFFKRRLMRKERHMVSLVAMWLTLSPYSLIFRRLSLDPW